MNEFLAANKDWIPFFIALIGVIGTAGVHYWQKSLDRRNEILRERRKLYRDYVSALSELLFSCFVRERAQELTSALGKVEKLTAEMYVTAPDHVAGTLKELEDVYMKLAGVAGGSDAQLHTAANAFKESMRNSIQQMRRDTYKETEVTTELDFGIFPTLKVKVMSKK